MMEPPKCKPPFTDQCGDYNQEINKLGMQLGQYPSSNRPQSSNSTTAHHLGGRDLSLSLSFYAGAKNDDEAGGIDDDANYNNKRPQVFFCRFCPRKFYNSQALGGHQNAHKRERTRARSFGCINGNNSVGAAICPSTSSFGHSSSHHAIIHIPPPIRASDYNHPEYPLPMLSQYYTMIRKPSREYGARLAGDSGPAHLHYWYQHQDRYNDHAPCCSSDQQPAPVTSMVGGINNSPSPTSTSITSTSTARDYNNVSGTLIGGIKQQYADQLDLSLKL